MRHFTLTVGLLFVVALPFYAQNWTSEDSLKLNRVLKGDVELKINTNALKELEIHSGFGNQNMSSEKKWLDFDNTLPSVPGVPEKKIVLTLHPYTANTRYNWDPVYQKKIKVGKDTWRDEPFYALYKSNIPSNWAKKPFDPGIRKSVEEIEATGLRYTSYLDGATMINGWRPAGGGGGIGGLDLMSIFTKDFWDVKGRKRRARTLEILKAYGDSTTVSLREPLSPAISR